MSTKGAAIHTLLSSFGIPAYPVTSVPDDAAMPYLTYTLVTGAWGDGEVDLAVDVWYRTESEAAPNAMVEEISEAIGLGGVILGCDGGAAWVKRGEPFAQVVPDVDNGVKRRLVNLVVEYETTN